jgi:hypothetical protein
MKHARSNILAAALCAAWLCATAAAAADVTFDVQPRLLNLGETARATLTFHGMNGAPNVELPKIPGLQITGTGQQMQYGTGGTRVSLTYNLLPTRPGVFPIGPFAVQVGAQRFDVPEVRLEVRAKDPNAQEREMVFCRIVPSNPSPYVHQSFDLLLHIYFLPQLELTSNVDLLGGFPESGFSINSFEELGMVREEVQGQIYAVRRFRARARAFSAGPLSLQPAIKVGVVDPNSRRQRNRDPFFGMLDDPFQRVSSTPVTAIAEAATLDVRPIPAEGRPPDFAGAVGQFDFVVDVRPRELKVGEPITVSMRLQGVGNVAAARMPAYADSDAFRAYDARLVGDNPDPSAERGSKSFEQVVIPRTAELKELPALRFSFFDPASGQYRTIGAGPYPLTVHPSENGANALLLQVPGAAGGVGKSLVLGSDIVYLKAPPARWRSSRDALLPAPAVVALHAAAPLALAGLFFATRRRDRLAADVALARRQKAPRIARAKLRQAEKALAANAPPADVFTPLAAAVFDYFAHRLNLPPGAVDDALILGKLRAAKADESALSQWRDFFALADQVRFGSGVALPRETLAAWPGAVAGLLRKAERSRL